MFTNRPSLIALFSPLALTAAVLAQTYDLSWSTIDGGGATFSTGGAYSLGGTSGQPDAGSLTTPMSGGAFTLVGGFWPAAGGTCTLAGDMNLDGARDGVDVQGFVNCLLGLGANCSCADLDASGTVNTTDAASFVQMLLS